MAVSAQVGQILQHRHILLLRGLYGYWGFTAVDGTVDFNLQLHGGFKQSKSNILRIVETASRGSCSCTYSVDGGSDIVHVQ